MSWLEGRRAFCLPEISSMALQEESVPPSLRCKGQAFWAASPTWTQHLLSTQNPGSSSIPEEEDHQQPNSACIFMVPLVPERKSWPSLHSGVPGQSHVSLHNLMQCSQKPGGFQPSGLISVRVTAPLSSSDYCHYLLLGRADSRNSASSSSRGIDR